jgi:hypothetical protein
MWKKTYLPILVSALIIVVVLVAVLTIGTGATSQSTAQAQPGPTDAQGILNQAIANAGSITNGTGQFNVSVNVNADTSKMPAAAGALLGQPITISGNYAFSDSPQAAQATINASFAGQTFPIAIEAVNGQAYVQLMNQWYVLPANMMKGGSGTTGTTAAGSGEPDIAGILQAATAAGIDPTTWLTNLAIVGTDSVNGAPTYHLSGTVNVNQIVTDVMKLMQNPSIQGMFSHMEGMMGSSGSTQGSTQPSITLPSQDMLRGIQQQITSMLQNMTIDFWVTEDTYQFRQVELKATIVPSGAGQTTQGGNTQNGVGQMLQGIAQGINSVAVDATVSIAPATTPLTITPPADAKPFSDLLGSLQALQGLFSGSLGGMMGTTPSSAQ